jgi:precorrin-3B synthase
MSALAPSVKGWCPGALRPMQSGDGLLMRAKIIGSALNARLALEIARIAQECGNGQIDLSQRAQLQLRGVSEATHIEALRRLDAASLLARNAQTESRLNILASPLAGLGRHAFDANALARALACSLAEDETLAALPPKFLFLVDDGGAPNLHAERADIRIEAHDAMRVALSLDGARDLSAIVAPHDAIDAALALAHAFVVLRDPADTTQRRMCRVVAARGAAELFLAAHLDAQMRAPPHAAIGPLLGAQLNDGLGFAGLGAPLGRLTAQQLLFLAEAALRHGLGELRLTPWRALLLPTASAQAAQAIVAEAAPRGFIVAEDDPRLAVVACPGAPECESGLGATRAHLAEFAPLARRLAPGAIGLHVSGCEKGCARPHATRVTLIPRGKLYDLIDNGHAGGAPTLTGLTRDAALKALDARAISEASCRTR